MHGLARLRRRGDQGVSLHFLDCKAAAKAKAKAEAAAAKLNRGKSTDALEVETVSSAAEKMQLQQRVLNLMKYRANHSKDAEKKSQAQQFLDMYWSKTAAEKEGLLKELAARTIPSGS